MVASGGCIRLLAACVQQPQAACASQANESRRHALQEGQLCRPGRSKMCSWKGRRGKPTEMKLLVQWRKRLHCLSALSALKVLQSTGAAVSGLTNKVEDCQTENIFECRANISQMDIASAAEGWRTFR